MPRAVKLTLHLAGLHLSALRLGVGVCASGVVGDLICWAARASSSASKLLSSFSLSAATAAAGGGGGGGGGGRAEQVVSATETASGVVSVLSLVVRRPLDLVFVVNGNDWPLLGDRMGAATAWVGIVDVVTASVVTALAGLSNENQLNR